MKRAFCKPRVELNLRPVKDASLLAQNSLWRVALSHVFIQFIQRDSQEEEHARV